VPGSVAPARGLILAEVVGRADGTICVGFGPGRGTVLSLGGGLYLDGGSRLIDVICLNSNLIVCNQNQLYFYCLS
jgi:hypothetical protein